MAVAEEIVAIVAMVAVAILVEGMVVWLFGSQVDVGILVRCCSNLETIRFVIQ